MSKIEVTKSSGNVFADIGLPNPEEHRAKADLVIQIAKIIERDGLTQVAAAKRMKLSQPDVSKILKGHFDRFSIERLLLLLRRLGQDVTIEVAEPKRPRKIGKLSVTEAARPHP
jgi:predicted XRE-type DNA-binding protein